MCMPAVDRQRRASNEIGVFRGQEGNAAGDILGMAQTPDWDFGDDLASTSPGTARTISVST